jgi:hypothetical protein
MNYKSMLEEAKKTGHWDEKKMWATVEEIDKMLCIVKEHDPQAYWDFMRRTYGELYGGHYGEEFARYDVSKMHSEQSDQKEELVGEYWSVKEVVEATKDHTFPSGTTEWDKYVAFNAAKHDWGLKYSDPEILKIGYLFYFADKDYAGKGKIWNYMEKVVNEA